MKETFTHKSLFIGIGLQDIRMCLCYMCNYNFIYFECPKGTGAKLYSRPRTLASTGAKAPVAPVESAPMIHGLRSDQLHLVARVTTTASILYATPAWWGFAGVGDRQRLERLVARLRRMGYMPTDFPSVESLAEEADRKLFKSISQCTSHALRH